MNPATQLALSARTDVVSYSGRPTIGTMAYVNRHGDCCGEGIPNPTGGGGSSSRWSAVDHVKEEGMALRKFIIERDIPKVGTFEREQLRGAAAKSNGVLRQLGPDIQWLESYVADNKTFCVYLAKDEDVIRKHAEISGFPATKITEVRKMIDPTTELP
jgi:hypothetical protein